MYDIKKFLNTICLSVCHAVSRDVVGQISVCHLYVPSLRYTKSSICNMMHKQGKQVSV